MGDTYDNPASAPGSGAVTYSTSDASIATVDDSASVACSVAEEICSACFEQAAVNSRAAVPDSTVEAFTTFLSASLGRRKYGQACSANAKLFDNAEWQRLFQRNRKSAVSSIRWM